MHAGQLTGTFGDLARGPVGKLQRHLQYYGPLLVCLIDGTWAHAQARRNAGTAMGKGRSEPPSTAAKPS